jgi:hypothetical protein
MERLLLSRGGMTFSRLSKMMHRGRNVACVGWRPLVLCFGIGLVSYAGSAQDPLVEPNQKPGDVVFDVPIGPPANGDDVATSPTLLPDDTLARWHELQRLPPVDGQADGKKGDPAGFGFGPGFGPGMGPGNRGPVSYRAFWFPNEPVKGQPANWALVGQDFSLACPLWVDLPNMLMVTAGVRNRLIDTDAILPDTHQPYPSELWDAQVGLMYMRKLSGDRMLGGGVSVGSASDHPFASIGEMNVSMNAMYRIPSGERNAWMFMVMYSPTSELQIPIPGVSYSYNPSDKFHANIGLPFMISYTPNDRWSFVASYMLIHTIHVKATYKIAERVRAFAGYDWSNEVYMLRDRVVDSDRFFLYDQRVTLGLDFPISSWLSAEFVGGYAFNRFSFSGSQWDSVGTDRVEVDPGPFMSLGVSVRR